MHTKGSAANYMKKMLNLESCIYLGNDLNDISMFSKGIDDNDFVVIATNEKKYITDMLVKYLKSECEIKGINWEKIKLLVLKERDVNRFLLSMTRVLGRLNSEPNRKKEDIRQKYKVSVKMMNRQSKMKEKEANKRKTNKIIIHR